MVSLGFFLAIEFAERRYGGGPIIGHPGVQIPQLIFTPESWPLMYTSMALMTVMFTWRQRFIAAGVAVVIDSVLVLVRLVFDARTTLGTGPLWVMLACAVMAVTHRSGKERVLLLKGVGLGMLLLVARKMGNIWLLITATTRPTVLDEYLAAADHALGNPSWLAGRLIEATGPVPSNILHWVYTQLTVAAVVVAFYQLRNVAKERRFPRHHLVRTFLAIGLLGPAIYMIFPVVGPVYAFGAQGGPSAVANLWPDAMASIPAPHHMTFNDLTPRNCMPSLHTAWATAIFIHSRQTSRLLRYAGTFWLVATVGATLGFGYHYGVDIIAGVVFTLTIEGTLRAQAYGWKWLGVPLVAYGTTVFAGLLMSYRYLPTKMARYPGLFAPLLLLAMGSVIYAYVRTTTKLPEPKAALVRAGSRFEGGHPVAPSETLAA
ncbi:inositol phosphorylceramide synthase [Streptomyces sp. YC504]|uniref:Inositol phosphorylceramide synthase n=2 Tax=Streptomyces mesophilus TaxID=1775132 RepID=A0A6G4XG16_9ACTN|nr:inositol phosphorylceramide synthase [Streptomyces mesophilus]